VQEAVVRLPAPLRAALSAAQVITAELPGAEVVADGIDPRVSVLLDTAPRGNAASGDAAGPPTVTRIFVYQRNVERAAEDAAQLNDEIDAAIEDELCALFPELAAHATKRLHDDDHEH
jgi:hypothetical protein